MMAVTCHLVAKLRKAKGAVSSTELLNIMRTVNATVSKLNQIHHLQSHAYVTQTFSNIRTIKGASILYSSLIRECTKKKILAHIKATQSHMIISGFPFLRLGDKLIEGYQKCGSIFYARKLFDVMPEKHIVTWNSMIASFITHKRSKDALELYQKMVLQGVLLDDYTFTSVFKVFSELDLKLEGRRAHALSVVLGWGSMNAFVGSALVDMYVKFGNMRDAKLVLDRVAERDVVLFTALIVGCSQQGQDVEALEAFRTMIKEGIKANEYTFASILISCGNLEDLSNGKLIHDLIIKMGFESAVASQTSLLTMYSKCGLIDDCLTIFKWLDSPNQVTWTSLIAALVQNGREEIALSKFRKMIRNSVSPNSFTLSSILRGCASLAMLNEGKQVHAMVTKFGLDRDRYAGAALIDLYGKCGSPDRARLVFDSLIEVDIVSTNSMIYSYAQNGFGHEALNVFNKMQEMRLKPNDVTYVSILLACNNAGLVEEGCNIFSSMKDNDYVKLSIDQYACMVDLLGRSGRLEEAETLINQVHNADVVLWRTLLSACRFHGETGMAERVKARVLELAPADEGTHVLLSNLYASKGKWHQVIEMKSTMKEMWLKKNPAMSWVDVNKEVHTFTAGDCSHPNSREIFETLEKLIEKVRFLGYVPDTKLVLQDIDEDKKVRSLYYHSEKLAIAFALWKTSCSITSIRIFKNLRVCGDCHLWIKLVSKVVRREIIARDAKRFHHFKDGFCSCGDYW